MNCLTIQEITEGMFGDELQRRLDNPENKKGLPKPPQISGGVVYCIEHVPTGRKYIGSTLTVWVRFKAHLNNSNRVISPLYDAVREFGWSEFRFCILSHHPKGDHLEEERRQIVLLRTEGACGFNVSKKKHSPPNTFPFPARLMTLSKHVTGALSMPG